MRQLFLLITAASLLDLGCAGCDDGSQSPRPTADAAGADSTSPDAGSGSAGWTQKGGTLSMEPEGWAYSPSVAGRSDGTLFAVWSQHRKADVLEKVSPYASSYTNGQWQALGGRIGHDGKEGYDPSIALLGTTPYVIWYEGQGYGWDTVGTTFFGSSVFVAHWNGSSWVADDNAAMANGSLHTAAKVTLSGTDWTVFARSPRLAVSGGHVYAATFTPSPKMPSLASEVKQTLTRRRQSVLTSFRDVTKSLQIRRLRAADAHERVGDDVGKLRLGGTVARRRSRR